MFSTPTTHHRPYRLLANLIALAIAVVATLVGTMSLAAADASAAHGGPTAKQGAGTKGARDKGASKTGRQHKLRITNGVRVSVEQFPWMAAIIFNDPQRGWVQWCGGSVVNSRWILTAAHCVIGQGSLVPAGRFRVIVGRDRLSTTTGRVVAVNRIKSHPAYNDASKRNDLAVMELAEPVSQAPATLVEPGINYRDGDPAVVIGWGKTETMSPSDDLLGVGLELFSDTRCQAVWPYDPTSMLCAGYLPGANDSCNGDSGGPLMIPGGPNRWKLIGIVSFGSPNCGDGTPAVYTWMGNASFQEWVRQNTPVGGGDPGTPVVAPSPPNRPVVAQPPTDRIAPVIQTLAIPSRFRAARRGASMATRIGGTVRYRLSEEAVLRVSVERVRRGRSVRRMGGALMHAGRPGSNHFAFTGRVGGRKLQPGQYRMVARATDDAGNSSVAERVTFRIVR